MWKWVGVLAAVGFAILTVIVVEKYNRPDTEVHTEVVSDNSATTPTSFDATIPTKPEKIVVDEPKINEQVPDAPLVVDVVDDVADIATAPPDLPAVSIALADDVDTVPVNAPVKSVKSVVNFVLIENARTETSFDNSTDLVAKLDELAKAKHPSVSLRIEFPASLITEHHPDIKFFQNFISMANYYAFFLRVKRAEKISVLQDIELIPAKGDDVLKRGCVRLNIIDDKWAISIKGLDAYPRDLKKVVENIIIPALSQPQRIAKLSEYKGQGISAWLKEMGKSLPHHQGPNSDRFMRLCTLSDAMSRVNIQSNLAAFGALIKFEEQFSLSANEKEAFINARTAFLNFFYVKIVIDSIKDLLASNDTTSMLWSKHRSDLHGANVKWIKDAKIGEVLLRHLFVVDPPCLPSSGIDPRISS